MVTSTHTSAPVPVKGRTRGQAVIVWLTTTDHKKIGHLYLIASFLFFAVAGVMALLLRAELARPGIQILSSEQYNQTFTMHGTIMLLLFATPTFAGFANAVMPLQIGSPDVAFPRLNMLSFWLFFFGGLIVVSSLFTPRARPTSAGPPTHRSAAASARRTWAATCGSWAWRWPGSAPSSAPSTSSRRSSACARRE